jgi:quercetin dioxygenase-like cupin family protein
MSYKFFEDLAAQAPAPSRGILSLTLSEEAGVELVVFGMAAGERLSEHTAARPAIVHVLKGSAELIVDGDTHALKPGAWLRMATGTPHAIRATAPFVFALYLLPKE